MIRSLILLLLIPFSAFPMHWCNQLILCTRSYFSSDSPPFNTIHDAPLYSAYYAQKLAEQPFFQGYWRHGYPSFAQEQVEENTLKVFSTPEWIDSGIIAILAENAALRLGTRSWPLRSIPGTPQLMNSTHTLVSNVLAMPYEGQRCSVGELREAFEQCVIEFAHGWQFPAEKPMQVDDQLPKPEERKNWHLLIKKKHLQREDVLASYLIWRLQLQSSALCPHSHVQDEQIQLWIKAGALETALKKLGIS